MILCKHYFAYLVYVKLWLLVVFFMKLTYFEENEYFSYKPESSSELRRAEQKFSDNSDHNILGRYNVSVQFPLATTKS